MADAFTENYHKRVLAHDLAVSCADDFEDAMASHPGMSLNDARKFDSTWYSTVKVYKARFPVFTGDAMTSSEDRFVMNFYSEAITNDVRYVRGFGNSAGSIVVGSSLPDELRSQSFNYRQLGYSARFIPTQELDIRAGEIGCITFSGSGRVGDVQTLEAIREYPWGWVGQLPAGGNMDLAHSRNKVRYRAAFQGGHTINVYDASAWFENTFDPDAFVYHDGANLLYGGAADGFKQDWDQSAGMPLDPAGPATFHNLSELSGGGVMVGSGISGNGNYRRAGTVEIVRILEICIPSQLYTPQPITMPMRPSSATPAARRQRNLQDLEFLAAKAEGAVSWLGKNWRTIARKGLAAADAVTTTGSVLGVPGMGAIDAARDMIAPFI